MAGKDEGSDSMRMWGVTMRILRISAGVTYEELANYVGYSKSLIVGIERGTRMPSESFVRKADEYLKANGILIEAAKHLSRQKYPSWFEEYAAEEQKALSVWAYDTHALKGLFQTAEYARAVLSARYPVLDDDEIESRVKARMERQLLLIRKPSASISAVIEESVLRRPVGGEAAHKGQLERLLELSEMRSVSIQVMPMSYESHAGFDGPLTLLETAEHQWLAYVEGQAGGLLIEERDQVSELQQRYGMIRTQALTPGDSVRLIKQLVGEL